MLRHEEWIERAKSALELAQLKSVKHVTTELYSILYAEKIYSIR